MHIYKNLPKLVLPSGIKNTPKIVIFRMCYGENGMVKFLETLADHVFRHKYSMIQIFFKLNYGKILGLPRSTPLNYLHWQKMQHNRTYFYYVNGWSPYFQSASTRYHACLIRSSPALRVNTFVICLTFKNGKQ